MKKLKSRSGFTLIEMMAALLIMVLLVMGMGTGMNAGTRVYSDSIFESDSSSLAGILNNALGDALRYSQDVTKNTAGFIDSEGYLHSAGDVDFTFTSFDYGVRDAYFCKIAPGSATDGTIQMKCKDSPDVFKLVNTGAYPNLEVSSFQISYEPPKVPDASGNGRGAYFQVDYTIADKNDATRTRDISYVVRLMNVPA